MKIENFIVALENYYECKYSQEIINRISKWMQGNGVREDHLDTIFDNITANFRPFSYKKKPDLKDIVDAFSNQSVDVDCLTKPFTDQKKMIAEMQIRDIIKLLKYISKKDSLSVMEIDIMHDWGSILVEFDVMMEHKMQPEEIKVQCENIKTAVVNNKKWDSIFDRIEHHAKLPDVKDVKTGIHSIGEVL